MIQYNAAMDNNEEEHLNKMCEDEDARAQNRNEKLPPKMRIMVAPVRAIYLEHFLFIFSRRFPSSLFSIIIYCCG